MVKVLEAFKNATPHENISPLTPSVLGNTIYLANGPDDYASARYIMNEVVKQYAKDMINAERSWQIIGGINNV